jgi:hypothetical protein
MLLIRIPNKVKIGEQMTIIIKDMIKIKEVDSIKTEDSKIEGDLIIKNLEGVGM